MTTTTTERTEQYWVGSDGENLEQMYFSKEVALSSSHRYLDSFDTQGHHVESYIMSDEGYILW